MEQLHQQFLEDETPENERARLDPDHWYENNLCNASLFANLAPEKIEGMEENQHHNNNNNVAIIY